MIKTKKIILQLFNTLKNKRGEVGFGSQESLDTPTIYTFKNRKFIVDSEFTGRGETQGEILLKILVNSANSDWTCEEKCGIMESQTPLVDCVEDERSV